MTTAVVGELTALIANFTVEEGGALTDLDATPTITITNAVTGVVAIGPTTSGVLHLSTGVYSYPWTPAASLSTGLYNVSWSGLIDGDAVSAAEVVTLLASGVVVAGANSPFGIVYTTRERVANGIDQGMSWEVKYRLDEYIEAASRSVEGYLNRIFYPRYASHRLDWPTRAHMRGWRIWLDQNELISLVEFTSGGTVLDDGDLLLYPDTGPPYNRIEVDLGSTAALSTGDTYQRSIVITGWFGYSDDSIRCGTLDADIDTDDESMDVTDSSKVGVGTVIRVDNERVLVTERSWITAASALAGNIAAAVNVVTVPVASGAAYVVGELILIDSEKMVVDTIVGNNLTVRRAQLGTILAAHTNGATVYAPRRLAIRRAVMGTSAASHSDGALLARWVPHRLLETLVVAETISMFMSENSAYARTIGSGDNEREVRGNSLHDLRKVAEVVLARRARFRSV
jgi:hypothetical protein